MKTLFYAVNTDGDLTVVSDTAESESEALALVLNAENDYVGFREERFGTESLEELRRLASEYLENSVIVFDGRVIHNSECRTSGTGNSMYITLDDTLEALGTLEVCLFEATDSADAIEKVLETEYSRTGKKPELYGVSELDRVLGDRQALITVNGEYVYGLNLDSFEE